MQGRRHVAARRYVARCWLVAGALAALVAAAGSAWPPAEGQRAPSSGVAAAAQATSLAAAGCPVHPDACTLAAALSADLARDDMDAVSARLHLHTYVCPERGGTEAGGPFPLCEDAAPGERRSGMPFGFLQSEGVVYAVEQYLGMLHYWLARAQPAAADDVGSGALRLFGFGCPAITPAEGPRCRDAFTLVFSAIGQGAVEPFRYQLIFVIEQPAGTSTLGITETLLAGSMALGEEFDVVQHGGALD